MKKRVTCSVVLLIAMLGVVESGNARQTDGVLSTRAARSVVVPNVVGLRMDQSTRLLHGRGFRVNEECPEATFGCILKSGWWICRQYPLAGARVAAYSKITTYGVRQRGQGC